MPVVCKEHAPWLAKLAKADKDIHGIEGRMGRRAWSHHGHVTFLPCRFLLSLLLFASLAARGIASNTAPEVTFGKVTRLDAAIAHASRIFAHLLLSASQRRCEGVGLRGPAGCLPACTAPVSGARST